MGLFYMTAYIGLFYIIGIWDYSNSDITWDVSASQSTWVVLHQHPHGTVHIRKYIVLFYIIDYIGLF